MDKINTEYLQRCIDTLEKSYQLIKTVEPDSIEYEMYRNSLVKGFEITIEQSGKLLKKALEPYFPSKSAIDSLYFKDIFRYGAKHGLIDTEAVERWFKYRENRNNTAHDYGVKFAQETLLLIDNFLNDAKNLKKVIDNV